MQMLLQDFPLNSLVVIEGASHIDQDQDLYMFIITVHGSLLFYVTPSGWAIALYTTEGSCSVTMFIFSPVEEEAAGPGEIIHLHRCIIINIYN